MEELLASPSLCEQRKACQYCGPRSTMSKKSDNGYFAVNSPFIFQIKLDFRTRPRSGGRGARLPGSGTQAQGPVLETNAEKRVG